MQNKEPRVLVGCPVTSAKKDVLEEYLKGVRSLTYKNKDILLIDNSPDKEMFNSLKKNKDIEMIKSEHTDNIRGMIVRDRNLLRKRALEKGYDYFFSLEQDVVPPADVIEKLMANSKDVCCGLYFNFFEQQRDAKSKLLDFQPVFFTWLDPELKDLRITRRMTLEEVFPGRLMQLPSGGTGCMLISRNVLEKIEFRYVKEYEAFDDIWFCNDCMDNGIEVWLDSSIVCNHLFGGWTTEMRESVWKK